MRMQCPRTAEMAHQPLELRQCLLAYPSAWSCRGHGRTKRNKQPSGRWKLAAGPEPADPAWDKELSVFRSRKNKPNQLELLRRLEEESEVGKVCNSPSRSDIRMRSLNMPKKSPECCRPCLLSLRIISCEIPLHENVHTVEFPKAMLMDTNLSCSGTYQHAVGKNAAGAADRALCYA